MQISFGWLVFLIHFIFTAYTFMFVLQVAFIWCHIANWFCVVLVSLEAKEEVRAVIEGRFTPEKFDVHLAEVYNKYNYRRQAEEAQGIRRLRYPDVKKHLLDLPGFNLLLTRPTSRTVKVCVRCLGVSRMPKQGKPLTESQYVGVSQTHDVNLFGSG